MLMGKRGEGWKQGRDGPQPAAGTATLQLTVKRMFFSLTRVLIGCNQHGLPRLENDLRVCRFGSGASMDTEC